MNLSPSEFAQRLGTPPLPVLFLDTCAILDIVRLPVRKSAAIVQRELAAIRAIIDAAVDPNLAINILLPEQVSREWDENLAGVESEVDREITKWTNQGEQFTSALSHFGWPCIPQNLGVACRQVVADLKGLATEIFTRSILVNDDEACMSRAMRRVLSGSAPAQKGEQGKDCAIVEHVLAASQIVQAGGSRGCIFLSSNTKDYRQPSSSTQLRPPLDSEFAVANLTFCTEWHWARSKLGV